MCEEEKRAMIIKWRCFALTTVAILLTCININILLDLFKFILLNSENPSPGHLISKQNTLKETQPKHLHCAKKETFCSDGFFYQ